MIGESPIRKSSPGVQRKVGAQQNGASPRISQKSNNTTKRDVKDPVRVSQKGNGEKEAKAPARRPQKTIGDAPAVKRSNDVDAPVRASQKRKDDVVVDDPPVPNYEEGVEVSDGEEENAKDADLMAIHQMVQKVKHDREVSLEYMKIFERERLIREDGYASGKEAELVEIIRRKQQKGLSADDIAEWLELDKEYVEKVMKLLEENPDADDMAILAMV